LRAAIIVAAALIALLPFESVRRSFFLELWKIIIILTRWLTRLSLVGARMSLVGRGIMLLKVLLEIYL
jgi:hypothetical protein